MNEDFSEKRKTTMFDKSVPVEEEKNKLILITKFLYACQNVDTLLLKNSFDTTLLLSRNSILIMQCLQSLYSLRAHSSSKNYI